MVKLSKPTKKQLIIGSIAIVLIVGGGTGAWYLLSNNDDNTDTADQTVPDEQAEELRYELNLEQIPYEELRDKVEQFTFTQQYDEAIELIEHQEYFASNFDANMLLVSVYLNADRKSEALSQLKQMAEAFEINKGIAENIGDLAAEDGDVELAKEYYRQAIELAQNPENPLAEYEAEMLQEKIDALEG